MKLPFLELAFCFIPLLVFYLLLLFFKKGYKAFTGLFALLLGLLSVIPIAALQLFLDKTGLFSATSLFSLFLEVMIVNGLVEESIKMGFEWFLPSKNVDLSVFMCYGILAGFSLGCFETVIYLISGYEKITLRLFTAVALHAGCAGLSSIFVYSAKKSHLKIMPFIYAFVLHGVYNYFAGFDTWLWYFSLAVLAAVFIELRVRYNSVKNDLNTDEEGQTKEKVLDKK